MRASSGRPKASVLPEPVAALPSTSRPASASGRAEVWMANGRWMPRRSRAVTSGWGRPSWWKVGPSGTFSSGVVATSFDSNDTGWTTVMRGGAPLQLGARPVKKEGAAVDDVLAGDRCAQVRNAGSARMALMPGQTVREDDRPMCRYVQVSSEDRRGIPQERVAMVTRRSPEQGCVPRTDDAVEQV